MCSPSRAPSRGFRVNFVTCALTGHRGCQGGVKRIQYNMVPLVFAALRLVQVVRKKELADEPVQLQFSSRKIFQFMHEIVTGMAPSGYPDLSLKLFLQCAMGADQCGFHAIAYEFLTQVR